MQQAKQSAGNNGLSNDPKKGYNEKNPAQPQGSFTAESNQKGDVESPSKRSVQKLEKRKTNLTSKK